MGSWAILLSASIPWAFFSPTQRQLWVAVTNCPPAHLCTQGLFPVLLYNLCSYREVETYFLTYSRCFLLTQVGLTVLSAVYLVCLFLNCFLSQRYRFALHLAVTTELLSQSRQFCLQTPLYDMNHALCETPRGCSISAFIQLKANINLCRNTGWL